VAPLEITAYKATSSTCNSRCTILPIIKQQFFTVIRNIARRIPGTGKSVVINVHPFQREKRRVLFLYNETLKQRRSSFRLMKARAKRMVKEHRLEVCIIASLNFYIKGIQNAKVVSSAHWHILSLKLLNIFQLNFILEFFTKYCRAVSIRIDVVKDHKSLVYVCQSPHPPS
jgi:hypothetical protein